MAIFGAPIAHEDHAVRACYAALAMQARLASLTPEIRQEYGIELRVRQGINSGDVVVRAINNDLTMDYDAIGSTVHLAGRMEQMASPGICRLTVNTLSTGGRLHRSECSRWYSRARRGGPGRSL